VNGKFGGGPHTEAVSYRSITPVRVRKNAVEQAMMKHLATILAALVVAVLPVAARGADDAVTVADDDTNFTLANGIVTAKVSKRTGDLVSFKYKDLEMLGASGHAGGYWSHTPAGVRTTTAVTIDPKNNDGARGEVSVKAMSNGNAMGSGPGGSVIADLEIRYALGRGDSGIYTYTIMTHAADYPTTSLGEARFCAKLNGKVFDYMTIDAKRKKVMPKPEDWDKGTELNMKEVRRLNTGLYKGEVEHKYDYSAIQFEIPAYGWSSTEHKLGLWFINPSIEYLSGGPTKVELTGHLDNNAGAAPTVLNYWRGSHYGGSSCRVAKDEKWTKVVGPFLIYCNSGGDHDKLWNVALARATTEAAAWPYDWVAGVDYPLKKDRGTVSGKITLNDPLTSMAKISNLLVGAAPKDVDWQMDAKGYQFWVRGDAKGNFKIANVRPGSYTLHAIANGVLGEYSKADITVAAGKSVDLGELEWKPVRHGKQLWEIGVPNRSAEEYKHGDKYWVWGLYNEYPKEFPDDVNFVIGKSDWSKDWNYAQPPRDGKPTTWAVTFDLAEAPKGKATLRLAICGSNGRGGVQVQVNDKAAGGTGPLVSSGVMHRDGIRGYWQEKEVSFDATLLKAGTNVIKLTNPGRNWTEGILYDYLRLELDEAASSKQ
jgi:rhamnogalacturonan endolyase